MEHLLEAEDDISNWEADQLMLEIDDALNDNITSHEQSVIPIHQSHRDRVDSRVPVSGDHRPPGYDDTQDHKTADIWQTSSLVTDDFGFPLSLFTKVSFISSCMLQYLCTKVANSLFPSYMLHFCLSVHKAQ